MGSVAPWNCWSPFETFSTAQIKRTSALGAGFAPGALAWAMALGAISAYASGGIGSVLIVCVAFSFVNLPSISVWVLAGEQVRHLLTDKRRLAVFNWTMAALLVLSLAPLIWH